MAEAKVLDNALLKGVMTDALVYRGIATDLDTCLQPGYYQVQDSTQNIPAGMFPYGIVTVKQTISFITQEFVPHNKSSSVPKYTTATRAHTQGVFTAWRILTWD